MNAITGFFSGRKFGKATAPTFTQAVIISTVIAVVGANGYKYFVAKPKETRYKDFYSKMEKSKEEYKKAQISQ